MPFTLKHIEKFSTILIQSFDVVVVVVAVFVVFVGLSVRWLDRSSNDINNNLGSARGH